MHKLLGLDFGASRIGIATGQIITQTTSPIGTVSAKEGNPHWNSLDKFIIQWNPSDIVVGLPIDAKDQETKITEQVRNFAKKVELRYKKPVHLISETFSTLEARWRLKKSAVNQFLI